MLNYKIHAGTANKPPLVILHGLLGFLDNWNSQAKKLSQSQTVITVDLRNHGKSPHVKGMSYREMSDDIIELLEYLNFTTCDLMGHSMGGKIAMTLALNHPEKINKLCIVDIAPRAYKPKHQKILQAMMSLPLADIKNRKEADTWLADWIASPVERGFLLKNLKHNEQGFYWQCNLAEIAKNYLKISGFSNSSHIQYSKPTLFIRGGRSDYIQTEDVTLIKNIFPRAEIKTLDDSGHLPHVEDADGFYRLLRSFFSVQDTF